MESTDNTITSAVSLKRFNGGKSSVRQEVVSNKINFTPGREVQQKTSQRNVSSGLDLSGINPKLLAKFRARWKEMEIAEKEKEIAEKEKEIAEKEKEIAENNNTHKSQGIFFKQRNVKVIPTVKINHEETGGSPTRRLSFERIGRDHDQQGTALKTLDFWRTPQSANVNQYKIAKASWITDTYAFTHEQLSGSKWDTKHTNFFHVLMCENQSPEHVVPTYGLFKSDNFTQVIAEEICNGLSAPEESELKGGAHPGKFLQSPYFSFFTGMQGLASVGEATVSSNDQRDNSQDNKSESVCEQVLHRLIEAIITIESTRRKENRLTFMSSPHHSKTEFSSGKYVWEAIDDGFIFYARKATRNAEENRHSNFALVRFEAKRGEPSLSKLNGQQAAEMIGSIMKNTVLTGKKGMDESYQRQETYHIRIIRSKISISSMFATSDYIDWVALGCPKPKPNERNCPHVYIRRTEDYDLFTKSGRTSAGLLILALLYHLRVGKPEISSIDVIKAAAIGNRTVEDVVRNFFPG